MNKHLLRHFAIAACALPLMAMAQAPANYPSNYAGIVAAARKEGKVRIYSSTDTAAATPLIKEFEATYPGIKVEYSDMNTTELYNRVISETAAGGVGADVTWSSSMDLQIKLVNDGFAQVYSSPEVSHLPSWAVWRNEGYGTTYEPVVFAFNKRLLKPEEVPQSHADLRNYLTANAAKLSGKTTSFDIEKSGVGFLFITQDARSNAAFWETVKALGATKPRFQSSTGTMLERISSGENLFGFNIIGTYALARAKKDPGLGVVMPKDYTLVMSRIMFINKLAQNPNASKLWLDFILSKRGQTVIANQSGLGSVRSDVEGELTIKSLSQTLGEALKPIQVGPGLLTYLDQAKRLAFINQWNQTLGK